MSIDSPEQADEVVQTGHRLKGDDYSEEGLRKQAAYFEEQLGPEPSPRAKQLLLQAIANFSP